jgi:hypothetical protein
MREKGGKIKKEVMKGELSQYNRAIITMASM